MSDKAKAYIYAASYFGLMLLLNEAGWLAWLDSQGTIVWLIGIFAPLIPMLYWLRNESGGTNLGVLAVVGFIAGVLAGKKID
tara:strand:+ start:570 stop:815 length:246 start_codon:yes stop_codon:yes gene_type:complete